MSGAAPRRRARAVVVALVLVAGVAGVGAGAPRPAAAAGPTIDTSSMAAVRDAYRNWFLPSQGTASWTGSTSSCNPGTSSAATQDATLSAVNFFRAMTGLEPVSFDPALSSKAQAAALIMAAQGALSHSPPRTWRCWTQAGFDGAAGSNLYLGVAGSQAIAGYMTDPGPSNTVVGHRRWLLHPEALTMGAGTTDRSQALFVFGADRAPTSTPAWVAWPSAGWFPSQLEPAGRWSLSSSDDANFDGAFVSVTDAFGQPVPITTTYTPSYGYGDDTLVWQMAGNARSTGLVNRTFNVTVSGIVRGGTAQSYRYQVRMFDALNDGASQPIDPVCGSDRGVDPVTNQAGVAAARLPSGSDVVQFTRVAGTAALACRSSSGGTWYVPVDLGGTVTGNPTATTAPDGTLRVFVRGADAALWMRSRTPSGVWNPWFSLGGTITTSPAATTRPDGTVVIVARGRDDALWTRTATTGWVSLGGTLGTSEGFGRLDTAADPAVAALPDGSVEIAGRGQDNALWRRTLTAGWTPLGGAAYSGPSVAAQGNRIHYLVRGINGALYWRTAATGWVGLGGIVAPTIAAVTRTDGQVAVLVRGIDSNSYQRTLASGSTDWSGWVNTGFPG